MTQDQPLAGFDAEALHLRPRLRTGAGRAGDPDRGPARRFRRLSAAQFRHELPGRRQRAAGAATVAQRAGGPAARRGRAGASDGALPPAGVTPSLPPGEAPGLAIGLGGVGMTLRDLVQLYTGLANGGRAQALARRHRGRRAEPLADGDRPRRSGRVAGHRHPVRRAAAGRRQPARHRLQDRHVLRLPRRLVGRLSTAATCSASGSAAPIPARCPACPAMSRRRPILFEGFARSGLAAVPLPQPAGRRVRIARSGICR